MDSAALLKGLNAPQVAAVTTTEGPVLVIAGAGSGKTRVITHRIAHLILDKGVAPWEIFAATFTNKAAREMKNRVSVLCGAADTVRLSIATFHSQCAHILRREAKAAGLSERFTICDDSDQIALLRDCINALNHNPKYLTPRSVQEAVSLVKMKLMEGDEAFNLIEEIRGASRPMFTSCMSSDCATVRRWILTTCC